MSALRRTGFVDSPLFALRTSKLINQLFFCFSLCGRGNVRFNTDNFISGFQADSVVEQYSDAPPYRMGPTELSIHVYLSPLHHFGLSSPLPHYNCHVQVSIVCRRSSIAIPQVDVFQRYMIYIIFARWWGEMLRRFGLRKNISGSLENQNGQGVPKRIKND